MKCDNCNKIVYDESSNYCTYCGEKLFNDVTLNKNIYLRKKEVRAKKHNNSKSSNVILSFIIICIVSSLTLFYIKGRPIEKAQIIKYIAGNEININDECLEVTENVVSELRIVNRQTKYRKFDYISGNVILDFPSARVMAPITIRLYYNNNKWNLMGVNIDASKATVEPAINPKDIIIDIIKDKCIKYNENIICLRDNVVKEVSSIDIIGEGQKRSVIGEVIISNEIKEIKMHICGEIYYSISNKKWMMDEKYLNTDMLYK